MQIKILRGFQAQIGSSEVSIAKQKAAALLAILVMDAPYRTSRAVLRGLLWSDSEEVAAQNSLRNTLWFLKKLLEDIGYSGLQSNRNEIWLEPESFETDLEDHLNRLSKGQVSLDLMPTQGFPDQMLSSVEATDLFEQRLNTYRERSKNRAFEICKSAAADAALDHDIPLLELLVGLDPINEAHCRRLIQALLDKGRKADALAEYQRLWNVLDEEYGEEPSQDTQAIIVALKQADEEEKPFGDGKPTIVVQSLDVTAQNPADRVRLQELREMVLSILVRFREWRIIDDDHCPDLRAILGRASGSVSSLSLTSFRPSERGDTMRSVLTDLGTGQVLWSEAMQLGNAGQMEPLERAVRQLATALNLHMSGPLRPGRAEPQAQANLNYESWIEAQHLTRQFTHESWQQAEGILDQILARDPEFVRALATRASIETMRHIAFPGVFSTPGLHRRALKWASTATTVDPMDSRAQLALGWACAMSRQFDRAELAYELAFQHNENDPWTIVSSSVGFAFCDQIDRALALLDYLSDLTLELEPVHWSYIAATRFLAGDDAGCIEMSERAVEISCDVPAWHSAALAHSGETEKATEVAARFRQITTDNWAGAAPPTDQDMTTWILSCFPIRNRASWVRLRDGLALSGLKTPDR